MANEDTVMLRGASGRPLDFDVYPWDTPFKPLGAVYAVLKRAYPDYTVIYVGQTSDLSERFEDHHKLPCFNRHGKTHIAIHLDSNVSMRLMKERDLVTNYSLVCNG